MNKNLSVAVVILVVFLVIPAICFAGGQGETKTTVSMRYSWWGGDARNKAIVELIDLYMAKNPHVTIEAEYGGFAGYYEKMITQLAGGTAPDILQVDYKWLSDLAAQEVEFANVYDLQDTIDLSGFDPFILESYLTVNGRLQGLPTGLNGNTMMYNVNFFKDNGIPMDTEWTWRKIVEVGKKVHANNPELYMIRTCPQQFYEYWLINYVIQRTGEQFIKEDYTIGFSKQNIAEALGYILSCVENEAVEPFEVITLYTRKSGDNPKWLNGQLGMALSLASLVAGERISPVDVCALPQLPDAKDTAMAVTAVSMLSMNKDSKYLIEAAEFVNFWENDPEAAVVKGDVLGVPAPTGSRQAAVDAGKIADNVARAVQTAMDGMKMVKTLVTFNRELADIGIEIVEKVGFKRVTPEQGAEELVARFEEKLPELR